MQTKTGPAAGPAMVRLMRRGKRYLPADRVRKANNLFLFVGYLELFGAMDFPANTWNEVPVPKFVKPLMIICGSLTIAASLIALVDMVRAVKNIQTLRQERAFLITELRRVPATSRAHEHLEAWLSVNFRELGWEVFDRAAMEVIVGFAGLLVGSGTIMAIGGNNADLYLASNLLSGYVGNGFVACYGLVNATWSAYLWQRGRRHSRLVMACIQDASLRDRAGAVFRNHQIYAICNGASLLVSSVGSVISSTRWWGYVLILPCIAVSVFTNTFWKRKIGYDRLVLPHRTTYEHACLHERINDAILSQSRLRDGFGDRQLEEARAGTTQSLFEAIINNEMLEDVCLYLANRTTAMATISSVHVTGPEPVTVHVQALYSLDRKLLIEAMDALGRKLWVQRAADRERVLYELLGALLSVAEASGGKEQTESAAQTVTGQDSENGIRKGTSSEGTTTRVKSMDLTWSSGESTVTRLSTGAVGIGKEG